MPLAVGVPILLDMGTDALTDYQQLGERLEAVAEQVKARRPRRKNAAGLGVPDLAGHPAEPVVAETEAVVGGEAAMPDGEVRPEGEGEGGEKVVEEASGAKASAVDLGALEALLFSTRHPLTPNRLAELIDVPSGKALRQAVAELNRQYEASGRCFRVEQVAGGYQLLTLPQFGELLGRLHQKDVDAKLTRSALETLAIIAYKQPVLRAEVEAIRGVASGETIRSLMEKHLVKIAGRAEEPGRPILYGTTKRFLELFGLNSLKDLPKEAPSVNAAATGEAAASSV